jgi:hypothetical protein
MAPVEYSGIRGKLIHEKNIKSKIPCQTPLKKNSFLNTLHEIKRLQENAQIEIKHAQNEIQRLRRKHQWT